MEGMADRKLDFLKSTPIFPLDNGPLADTALVEKATSVIHT